MKFLHIADLHLGRRLHDLSLMEDQRHVLRQILAIAQDEQVDAVLVAGDVYDKPVPPVEAVELLDSFLTGLTELGAEVFVVSGNHDSAERLAFGSRLLNKSRVHLAPVFRGAPPPVTLSDPYGTVEVYLLPFVKPVHVRRIYEDEEIADYTQAVEAVLCRYSLEGSGRRVLLCHQLVTGAVRSESELLSIGGLDNVDGAVFAPFDYVALGHLHRPQWVLRPTLRYAGAPLAYSFSEGDQEKSVTVVDLGEKGSVAIKTRPLTPLHAVRTLSGTAEALLEAPESEDYLRIVLTEADSQPNVWARLKRRYPNLLALEYGARPVSELTPQDAAAQSLTPLELMENFFQSRNGKPMDTSQLALVRQLMEEIWEDTL